MPTKILYLDQELTESMVLQWGFNWKNFTISKDGEVIGQFQNEKELRKGQSFQLNDDHTLSVKLKRKWGYQTELEVLLNNEPVPGSGTEPREQVKQVYYLLVFVALFNAGLGLIAELTNLDLLLSIGLGVGTIVIGLFYGIFAYLVQYKRSLVALYLSIAIMSLDLVLTVAFAGKLGGSPFSALFTKIFFIMMLLNGVKALKKLNSNSAPSAENALEPVSYS